MFKTKLKIRLMAGATLASAFLMGVAPVTAFAQGTDVTCTCDEKCSKDDVNEDCQVCAYDYKYCGAETTDDSESKESSKSSSDTKDSDDTKSKTDSEGSENSENAEESYGPLTPDGNLTLVDDYGSLEAGGKQFITVVTKAGNYFYIIIDRDDSGNETVHFLNMVDESDLMGLMDDDEAKEYVESVTAEDGDTESLEDGTESTEVETDEAEKVETSKNDSDSKSGSSNITGIMGLVLVGAIAGIGGFLYFKSKKNSDKKTTGLDSDEDYFEEDDEDDDVLSKIPEEKSDQVVVEDLNDEVEDDSSDEEE